MKNSIKREQSQACLNFAERKNFRLKAKNSILMTLALLLTAVSGAWAQTDPNTVEWDYQTWSGWTDSETTHTVGDITITATGSGEMYQSDSSGEPLVLQAGANDAITFTSNGKPFASISILTYDEFNVAGWTYNSSTWSYEWSGEPTTSVTLSGCDIKTDGITFTFGTAEPPIEVTPGSSANTWTFQMPGSDVVLTPQYAPTAKWDVVETVEQLPAALEGIIAGQDAAIVTPGQSAQGTVMYAVTTTAEPAPALTAFSATVPTAKDYDDATTLYVWYYIQGQDTPDGQQATEENTFNDSEICATPLTVNILTNKFDITFNAANANTIEAGKATVTVGGTAATVTDGKLQGVKMGSEVKMTAKQGYKFRKVEVKEGGAGRPAAEATADDKGKLIGADGNIYDDAAAATAAGTTAVTKIIYLGSETGDATYTHGLALALADEGEMTWATAVGTCSGKNTSAAVPGASWMLPSQVQWNKMISAAGSYTALRDSFSSVGGTNMSSYYYWSSTEIDSDRVYYIYFGNGNWGGSNKGYSDIRTRAVLAF